MHFLFKLKHSYIAQGIPSDDFIQVINKKDTMLSTNLKDSIEMIFLNIELLIQAQVLMTQAKVLWILLNLHAKIILMLKHELIIFSLMMAFIPYFMHCTFFLVIHFDQLD